MRIFVYPSHKFTYFSNHFYSRHLIKHTRRPNGTIQSSLQRKVPWIGWLHFATSPPVVGKLGLVKIRYHRDRDICLPDSLNETVSFHHVMLICSGYPEIFFDIHSQQKPRADPIYKTVKNTLCIRPVFKDHVPSDVLHRLLSIINRTFSSINLYILATAQRNFLNQSVSCVSVHKQFWWHLNRHNGPENFLNGCQKIFINGWSNGRHKAQQATMLIVNPGNQSLNMWWKPNTFVTQYADRKNPDFS